ncbi:splicing factor YJU2-like [Amphiura filiformis]|uniref:splicing factor YJU2-like n=1 Tax=Amphiura filiformis TaxID=82378 RepID=UPI003B216839
MSERKVLNKYYPPDFDPSKLPNLRQSRDRQYTVRIMAPFNMQCKTCGEYIYKGKKFNAKTENVTDEAYLGLRIYRFYIKCPKCISEINFKTDPQNTDYTLEHGATRLFEASKTFQKQEEQAKIDKEEEEANNPMKVLENRTKDSKLEMEVIENLEELRELKSQHANVNYADILKQKAEEEEAMLQKQEEEDEAEIMKHFGKTQGVTIKRLVDTEEDEDQVEASPSNRSSHGNSSTHSNKRPTDFLTEDSPGASPVPAKKQKTWDVSVGKLSSTKSTLAGLVKVKKPSKSSVESDSNPNPLSQDSPSITQTVSKPNETQTQNLESKSSSNIQEKDSKTNKDSEIDTEEASVGPLDSAGIMSSIREGLVKQQGKQSVGVNRMRTAKSGGLSLLGGYADSDSSASSDSDEES